jgi:TonB family protein
MIESHRFYPPNAVGSLGLPLEGTVVYLIEIRADGALGQVALARSSGADVLDQTALTMIRQAAPFPPLPQRDFPGPGVVLEVTIHLFPGMG